MKIFLMTGESATGKSTIARQVSNDLQIPFLGEREIIHSLATRNGFPRGRLWVASIGVEGAFDNLLTETIDRIEQVDGTSVVIDGAYDSRLADELTNRTHEPFIICVRAPYALRLKRMQKRLGNSSEEDALAEMRLIDGFKSRAGMHEIAARAHLTIHNDSTFDESVRKTRIYIESEIARRGVSPEKL